MAALRDPIREDRRQWLEDAGRLVLLGGFGALTVYLVSRGAGVRCAQPVSPCAACQLWKGCQLPKAIASKAAAHPGPSRTRHQS